MYLTTPALWPALLAFLALAIPLAITDARTSRLPLELNLGLLAAGAVLLPLACLSVPSAHLVSAVITAGTALGIMLVLFVLARGGLGFGDVILMAGLGLFAGFVSPLLALAGLWLGCLATLVASRIRRRRSPADAPDAPAASLEADRAPGAQRESPTVPFGPGLIAGAAFAMLLPVPGLLA